MTFCLGVPSKRNFYGWRGKNDNFTVEDVEEDISAIKNIRFTFKSGISDGQIFIQASAPMSQRYL